MTNISKIVSILRKKYPDEWAGNNDPYKTLISCLLSLRTKDETTYPAAERLFKKAATPKKMLKLSAKQIQYEIYPVGFYKTKSKRIKEISRTIIKKYGCKVPDDIDELMKLKGVGRKTANIVVTHAFNKPGIAVDTHVHRISNRLGYVKTRTPDETEQALRKKLPKKYWVILNELLVQHGKTICVPISPWCSKCPIYKYCKRINVKRKR
ncbi:endonuclease III [Candidatus Woesearchaeota archaeon]|nr:endonuclease III [Candidatus Woesearchaeota archaeon]